MVLIWEKLYAIVLDGVVKHLEEFGCDGIDSLHLAKIESRFFTKSW
jgi:hypothetical protein